MAARLVVFDCNIYLQAMLNMRGPAAACFERCDRGEVRLVLSPVVLAEVRALPVHPDLRRFPSLTLERVDAFLSLVLLRAILIQDIPSVFSYSRDPDDAHYVNLALAANASLIVSRDNDLLDLMNPQRPEGRDFLARFATLRIMRPDELLKFLRRSAE
jgi:putative PIN family toxin of toxin-antitoxin system